MSFYPVLPATGQYDVYAWWPAAAGNASNVPIDVTTATETRTVTVNQQQQGGQWVLLGTFTCNAVAVTSDSYTYDAFGGAINSSGSTTNPWQYGGQYGYYQDAPNRSYVRARHLHLATGRWMSKDPIGLAAGDANLYRAVSNNVVNVFDPQGLAPKGAVGKIHPAKVRLLQSSVSFSGDGYTIGGNIIGFREGTLTAEHFDKPIRIYVEHGLIWTLDHRRVVAARAAGVPLYYRWATAEEIAKETFKATNQAGGLFVEWINNPQALADYSAHDWFGYRASQGRKQLKFTRPKNVAQSQEFEKALKLGREGSASRFVGSEVLDTKGLAVGLPSGASGTGSDIGLLGEAGAEGVLRVGGRVVGRAFKIAGVVMFFYDWHERGFVPAIKSLFLIDLLEACHVDLRPENPAKSFYRVHRKNPYLEPDDPQQYQNPGWLPRADYSR